jgi:asparagine N-glycosylation enzyme membrane subunit Stt3
MSLGIYMGIAQDHTLAPAHAHLNLVGGVLLALFGAYYAITSRSGVRRIAVVQVVTANVAVVTLAPGIALAVQGKGEGLAIVGSLVALLSMLLFLIVVATEPRPAST